MDFPATEPDVMALSQKMLDGYFWHASDFPRVIRGKLYAYRGAYISYRNNHKRKQADLRNASKAAKKSLQELVQVMKNCLKKSEVDTANNPEKLREIGWGPRGHRRAAQLPGQPLNLRIVSQNDRIVKLDWDRPDDNQPVRNYSIERRIQGGDWTIIQIAYDAQITLRNQQTGKQLDYRIRAANTAGTGPFSNTVSVVL